MISELMARVAESLGSAGLLVPLAFLYERLIVLRSRRDGFPLLPWLVTLLAACMKLLPLADECAQVEQLQQAFLSQEMLGHAMVIVTFTAFLACVDFFIAAIRNRRRAQA